MSDRESTDELRTFIHKHIDSVVELEVLLLLYQTAPAEWSAESVSASLRITESSAATVLETLTTRELLARVTMAQRSYRYEPCSPQLRSAVESLATAYNDRRVTIISLIFSKPLDKIRIFADAFRIPRDKSNG
jgi:hypothetical protein